MKKTKKPDFKLSVKLKAYNYSQNTKKLFTVSLFSAILLFGQSFSGCFAKPYEPITFETPQAIKTLRTFYNSPAKQLNKVINRSYKTPQGLPAYSHIKGKAFIQKEYSKTKPTQQKKTETFSLFKWLSNDGKYSKFNNDPFYTKNVQFNIDKKAKNTKTTLYDYNNIETSIITVRINKKIAYDIEAIVWPDGNVSLPIGTMAKLLDVNTKVNHMTHNISFEQPLTKENILVDYKKNRIIAGTNVINLNQPKLILIRDGFLIESDIYVPQALVKDLLDIQSDFTKDILAFDIETSRVLKALVEFSEESEQTQPTFEKQEAPIKTITEGKEDGKFLKFRKLSYNVGSSMNQTSSYSGSNSKAMARAGFRAEGRFLGGDFNIRANTNYNQQGMTINNYQASLNYTKPKYELSLGATDARLSNIAAPGASILGFRFGSVGAMSGSSHVPRLIEGQADDNAYVELYVNGIYTDRKLVQNGRFEFDSLKYNADESMIHIVVEQVSDNGQKKKVFDRKFSNDRDLLAPGQRQFLVFSGIDSTALSNQFQLFGDKFDQSMVQPVKYISGIRFRTGLTENLTMGVNFAQDFMIRNPSKTFGRNIRNLNSARVFRTGRTSSGSVITLDFDYVASKNLRFNSEVGFSRSSSRINPDLDPDGTDFGGFLEAQYRKKNFSLNAKAFSYGPNFYSPAGYNFIDKRGFDLSSTYKRDGVTFTGNITRYNSNLDNYYEGGRSTVFDYNFYISGNIDEKSTLRGGVRSRGASNSLYYDRDTTFDLSINRKLSDKANLTLNYAKTIRKNRDIASNKLNKSSNDQFNAELTYNADKIGVIRLAHEMMMLDPVDRLIMQEFDPTYYQEPVYSKNIRLTLDRSKLPIKGITFSPNVGYRYGGQSKGLNFGCSLGYMFKSGKQLMLNYAYNSSFGRYMTGALNFGGSKSHTVSFNFVDSLNFGAHKASRTANTYKNPFEENSGVIKGSVFVDLNRNGIKDPGEEGISDIDITFKNYFDVTTDSDGNYIAANIPTGYVKVGVNKNTLPVFYTPTVADALVKVEKHKVYQANLGVIVTPGNIMGMIESSNDNIATKEVILLLLDENGNEIKYTTSDSVGSYYLGSIPPGKYIVKVDPNYLNMKGLQVAGNNQQIIEIPLITDDFYDLENIDFTLEPKTGAIKTF